MKRFMLSMLLALCGIYMSAQSGGLYVESFSRADDFTARINPREVPDYPGHYQALIKLSIPLKDVVINKLHGIISIEEHPDIGEYWIWTDTGENQPHSIQINHPLYNQIDVNPDDCGGLVARDTYRLVVSVPSPGVAEAERLVSNFKFDEAKEAYDNILNDPDAKKTDKEWARKHKDRLPEYKKLADNAFHYARLYVDIKKNGGEVDKSKVKDILEKAVYWFNRLYSESGIPKAKELTDRFYTALQDIEGTLVIKGTICLRYKDKSGQWVFKKAHKLEGVTVVIKNGLLHDKRSTMTFDTDNDGSFSLEIKNGYKVKLSFDYTTKDNGKVMNYKSGQVELEGDKHLDVVMVATIK